MKPRDISLSLTLLFLFILKAPAQETQRIYLSGHDKDDAIPWKFFCTAGSHSGYWTNLPVPSNWELHGFGTLTYHRDPTNPPPEQGRYQYDFKAPAAWSSRRVFLVFEGVMTDCSAAINGQSVGPVHQGAYYRFKYEVGKLLKFGGPNRLEVVVDKHSSNASVNNAERKGDYWMYGGIFRPVYLEVVPQQFIERVAIDARADGGFKMEAFVNGDGPATIVKALITTTYGKVVGVPMEAALDNQKATLEIHIASPHQWTAETPSLYSVSVLLKRGNETVHELAERFGFRTMEVRDGDGLYLNGQRVILKGCNRHSFWPESGRCLSAAVHRLDIGLMKDMNMNAVRMSHYPPDAEFLDLCDEMGLYVLDELAGWHGFYNTETGTKLVEEMVTRDVNHPCILFWDNGNEGGFNTNLDKLYGQFDPQQRRVLHPWAPFSGINTSHYLAYDKAAIACSGVPTYYRRGQELADTNDPLKYIYMPTEFNHGLYDGGAGAGLEDYWELMRNSRFIGGGFIWAFLDEGVKRPDTGKIDVSGNEAPDGIVGPYREKEASFYAIKEIWSPLRVWPHSSSGDFSEGLALQNHFSFTDANKCKFEWQLRKFRKPSEAKDGFETVAHGQTAALSIPPATASRSSTITLALSIPPGGSGALPLKLPEKWRQADALALRATDPSGREIRTWVWPLPGLAHDSLNPQASEPVKLSHSLRPPVVSRENGELVAKTDRLTLKFSEQTGMLIAVQGFSLTNGPRVVISSSSNAVNPATSQLTSIETAMDGPDALISATLSGDLRSVQWRIRANGWVQCDYTYVAEGPKDFFGVAFDYPERLVKAKKWLGPGPYRVWKNRTAGASLNVWQNSYNNTITGWSDWIYPEFKGCFAGVRWLQLETTEGPITVVPGREDQFVQVLTPEFPPARLVGKAIVSLPACGLALLDGIPPIGSKFKPADQSGPQGQLAVAHGEYRGSVNFYFGKLR